jgi:nucleoid DNA-binding protein
MTDAEYHQQQLEQMEYEETTAYLLDQYDNEVKAHIWSDDDTVFINFGTFNINFSLSLEKQQAEKVLELLTNALRRAA